MIYSEWRRYRSCDRKMRWPSSVVAGNWATLLGWKHGKPYESYRCSWCDGWHVATVRDEREAA